jgi:hypothetical protein
LGFGLVVDQLFFLFLLWRNQNWRRSKLLQCQCGLRGEQHFVLSRYTKKNLTSFSSTTFKARVLVDVSNPAAA